LERALIASIFLLATSSLLCASSRPPSPIIIIDPGHGGKDPGARAHHTKEKDLVLSFSKKLAQSLKKKVKAQVFLTRSNDVFIPLEKRDEIANQRQCDLFLSVHANASKSRQAQGIELYYLNRATDRASEKLANRENEYAPQKLDSSEKILSDLLQAAATEESAELSGIMKASLKNLRKKYSVKKIETKTALFYVLVGAKCPSLLMEVGFLTNPEEVRRLKRPKFQKDFAETVADAIARYLEGRTKSHRDL